MNIEPYLFAVCADRMFAALAKTLFSPRFGMVTDRFGVLWMIIAMP